MTGLPPPKRKEEKEAEDADIEPFPFHMTKDDAMKLSVDQKIDYRDHQGRFVGATVLKKEGPRLKIHYDYEMTNRWDTWVDVNVHLYRFALPGSISLRPSHQAQFRSLKRGDYVDINPSKSRFGHSGWKVGEIVDLDKKSGQVHVKYSRVYRYWAHLDNVEEIAPFATKTEQSLNTLSLSEILSKFVDTYQSHRVKQWKDIDIIKASLWHLDGKSARWIALQLRKSKDQVSKIIASMVKLKRQKEKSKEMKKIKESNEMHKEQRQEKENVNVNKKKTMKRKLESVKDDGDNLNEPPKKKIKFI